MKRPRPPRGDDEEARARQYLEQHPDFFERAPDLLARMTIPHQGPPGTISLIGRQLSLLREQLATERRRLALLIERARDYERLNDRLHRLTVKLVQARSFDQTRHALEIELRREFDAEAVALKLFPLDPDSLTQDPVARAFLDFIDQGRCLCGSLGDEHHQALFGATGTLLQSAVLIPLKGSNLSGVLAIGSPDAEHFTADMSTDVLARLSAIASAKLSEFTALHGC